MAWKELEIEYENSFWNPEHISDSIAGKIIDIKIDKDGNTRYYIQTEEKVFITPNHKQLLMLLANKIKINDKVHIYLKEKKDIGKPNDLFIYGCRVWIPETTMFDKLK